MIDIPDAGNIDFKRFVELTVGDDVPLSKEVTKFIENLSDSIKRRDAEMEKKKYGRRMVENEIERQLSFTQEGVDDLVINRMVRHEWPNDPPEQYGVYLVAFVGWNKRSSILDVGTMTYLPDPEYQELIWDRNHPEANEEGLYINPEPQKIGWYTYVDDGEWRDYTSDVQYWWKTPRVNRREDIENGGE